MAIKNQFSKKSLVSSGKEPSSSRAFTLIELLVVIAIIGILAGVVLVSLSGAKERAEMGKTIAFGAQIHRAFGAYAIGVWDFDNLDNGIASDMSGYGNHCSTSSSGVTLVASDISTFNNALEFDGANGYLDCGDDNSLNPITEITITAWVYRKGDGTNDLQGIVHKHGGGHNYLLAYDHSDGLVKFKLLCITINSDEVLPLEEWTHIAAVKGRDNAMKMYVNGTIQSVPGTCGDDLDSAVSLRIGQYGGAYFEGLIDEVNIYNETLTDSVIREHYLAGANNHFSVNRK